jgi:Na+/melibiose symporter-like transporter
VPYISWGTELTTQYEERNRVTAYRDGAFMLGNVLVAVVPLILLPKDASVGDVLFLISLMILILVPLALIPLGIFVADPPHHKKMKVSFIQGLRILLRNKPMIYFLVGYGFLYIALGIVNSVYLFLLDDGLGLPESFLPLFFIQYTTAILAIPIVVRLANYFGKHILMSASLAFLLIVYILAFMLPMGNYSLVVLLVVVFGLVSSCSYVLPHSILADIIDFDTVESGEQRAGIYAAAYGLVFKVGLALGVGLAYGFLDLAGYDPVADTSGPNDVLILRIAAFGITSILLLPAIYLLWHFPIDKQFQQELRRKIEAKQINPTEKVATNRPGIKSSGLVKVTAGESR